MRLARLLRGPAISPGWTPRAATSASTSPRPSPGSRSTGRPGT